LPQHCHAGTGTNLFASYWVFVRGGNRVKQIGGSEMTRTVLSLVTAAAVGVGALTATPQPANAVAWWVIPAIVGGAVVGVGVGAAAADSGPRAYGYERDVYVQPTAACHIERQRLSDGRLRRVRVCD
jgi:hypothetical protein